MQLLDASERDAASLIGRRPLVRRDHKDIKEVGLPLTREVPLDEAGDLLDGGGCLVPVLGGGAPDIGSLAHRTHAVRPVLPMADLVVVELHYPGAREVQGTTG